MNDYNQNTLLQPHAGGFIPPQNGMNVCSACGTTFSSNARFCPNCGRPVDANQQAGYGFHQPSYPPRQPVYGGPVPVYQPNNPNFTPGVQPMPRRKSAVGIVGFIFIMISLLFVIICIATAKHRIPGFILLAFPFTIIGHILSFIGMFKRPKAFGVVGFIFSLIIVAILIGLIDNGLIR